jgi:RNA polymerase sigma factor (sigma-70 family)
MGARSLLDMVQAIGRSEQLQADLAQPDDVLLERFVRQRDEAAFEAILHRHGPLVHSVCRRLLYDPDDTADAFQASFLVLARKASTIGRRALLANWLYGVAYRVAARARKIRRKQHAREQAAADLNEYPALQNTMESTLTQELCEEVQRLPERYRVPIILCYLEGKTGEEAAKELHCPATTVKGRLALAREMLRHRLTQRGVTVTAGLLVGHALAGPAPAALLAETMKAASAFAAGIPAGGVSAQVLALTKGVLRTMMLSRVKTVAAVLIAVAIVAGVGGVAYRNYAGAKPAEDKKVAKPKADKEAILGTWKVVSVEFGSKKNPEGFEFDLLRKATMIFKKDKQITQIAGGQKEHDYKLDSTKKPKCLDIMDGDPATPAIYSLDGDKLTICFPSAGASERKRPNKLATKEGDGMILLVLEREGKVKPRDK